MSKIDDGGPAFPNPVERSQGDFGTTDAYPGMGLRDWFAGQVLMGYQVSGLTKSILTNIKETNPTKARASSVAMKVIAHLAYAQADAMLAARKAVKS